MNLGRLNVVAETKSKKSSSGRPAIREGGLIAAGEKSKLSTKRSKRFSCLTTPHVKFEFEFEGDIPSEFGSYRGTRFGSVEMPVKMAIELAISGMLETDFQISSALQQRLLLALAASLARAQKEESGATI